jgi:hypothetical protein
MNTALVINTVAFSEYRSRRLTNSQPLLKNSSNRGYVAEVMLITANEISKTADEEPGWIGSPAIDEESRTPVFGPRNRN